MRENSTPRNHYEQLDCDLGGHCLRCSRPSLSGCLVVLGSEGFGFVFRTLKYIPTHQHNVRAVVDPQLYPDSEQGVEGNEEIHGRGDRPRHEPTLSRWFVRIPLDEDEETVRTGANLVVCQYWIANDKVGIRATDVTAGLRRLPANFFTLRWSTVVASGEPKKAFLSE